MEAEIKDLPVECEHEAAPPQNLAIFKPTLRMTTTHEHSPTSFHSNVMGLLTLGWRISYLSMHRKGLAFPSCAE